ncbi:cation:proton antiporter [Brevundimonas sp. BT-123]|uniref:cation:proton antiporter n=1 Tax=Brevundimonas sp. BT-123 TaxID=2986928 RepID=UPI0022364C0C|nr:cation:proton antiporter [Brevundimonas sp. BT-123]MCW0045079.1 cation:proton antiporter [Brevundimonas sp. BT-123]
MTNAELSVAFFLQMAIIIAACRIVGWLAKRYLGQPQVVGEMIAGVILGPSLFGLLAPDLQAALIPKESKSILFVGAQLGVGLYMFLVGLGFRRDHFRANAKSAAAVSLAGMAAPFVVAIAIAPWLVAEGLFGQGIQTWQAMLFMGAAISITAFPMLARIIHERGLSGTRLGSLSLAAGAIDDAGAWCILAVVLASFGAGPMVAVTAIAGGGTFALFMLTLGPKLLAPLGRIVEREGRISSTVLGIVLILFMLSAWAMDAVGIHAVFGGFILGVAMPRGLLSNEVKRQLEPFAVLVLLPMFFTFSGLNTQLTMVNSLGLLAVTIVILLGSILAKGGACWAAARLTGQDNATAMGIGALMNARGLMELIIINIGLQKGVIGPALFSILVLMAIITTLMASPLFEWVYGRKARERGELGGLNDSDLRLSPDHRRSTAHARDI